MVQNNMPPLIYGDGGQIRSFCYMEDAAQGVYKALTNPNGVNEIFNIGNNSEPISIKDLALTVIKLSGKKLEPKFVELNNSDRESSREIFVRKPNIKTKIYCFQPNIIT